MGAHDDAERTVVDDADDAYEAMRAICHRLPNHYPAPTVYAILGNLKSAGGHMLVQALEQLAEGLSRSLEQFDVYEDDGANPVVSVMNARRKMEQAAGYARLAAREMEEAQSFLSRQGLRRPGEPGYREPEDR